MVQSGSENISPKLMLVKDAKNKKSTLVNKLLSLPFYTFELDLEISEVY